MFATWALLLPLFLLAGVGIGCVETAEHTVVATHAPIDIRGSAFGLLASTQSFGNLAASLVAGILWAAFSPTWAFAYLTVAMAIALVTLIRSAQRNRRANTHWLRRCRQPDANDARAVVLVVATGSRGERHLAERHVAVFELNGTTVESARFIFEDPEAYDKFWSD